MSEAGEQKNDDSGMYPRADPAFPEERDNISTARRSAVNAIARMSRRQRSDSIHVTLDYGRRGRHGYEFDWHETDANINTVRDLCERLLIIDIYHPDEYDELQPRDEGILRIRDLDNDNRILQEFSIPEDLGNPIRWADWRQYGDYIDIFLEVKQRITTSTVRSVDAIRLRSEAVDVYLNEEFNFYWYPDDNSIVTIKDLCRRLGLNVDENRTLSIKEGYSVDGKNVGEWSLPRQLYSTIPFGYRYLSEVGAIQIETLEETVADLADQMRGMTMNSESREEDRLRRVEEQGRNTRREEDEEDILRRLRDMRVSGTSSPSRKRKGLKDTLKLRF